MRPSGTDWENWGNQLLFERYGHTDYQRVPDRDRGDAGIEGFSLDGCAYQLYGPEEPLSTKQRYIKHRDKITQDVGKFVSNQSLLGQLFGDLKIRRWILFVPLHDSKEAVSHATKKTGEVVRAALPYTAGEFRVLIQDETSFEKESKALLSAGLREIDVAPNVSGEAVSDWAAQNPAFVTSLDEKLMKLPTLRTGDAKAEFRAEVIQKLIEGQNVLEELRNYPQAWEAIRKAKSEEERHLRIESMLHTSSNSELLMESLRSIEESVARHAPALSVGTKKAVAWEAVAEWLVRCPLDFPTTA